MKLFDKTPVSWRRLLVALLILAGFSTLHLLFFSGLARGIPFQTSYPSVMLMSLYGGLKGFLGTAISAFQYFHWIQHGHISSLETPVFMVYIISCTMISFISEAMRRSHLRAKDSQEQAEEAHKAKNVFLSNMSHELCTSLNAIPGNSRLMQREEGLGNGLTENTNIINQRGAHVLSKINEALEIAKIEAGRIIDNKRQ